MLAGAKGMVPNFRQTVDPQSLTEAGSDPVFANRWRILIVDYYDSTAPFACLLRVDFYGVEESSGTE